METASTEVTSIWRRNDIEKSTWRAHRYFVNFENRIHVEISSSNRCHNSHVDSSFRLDVTSTNFPRGICTSTRWQIEEDMSIGYLPCFYFTIIVAMISNFLIIYTFRELFNYFFQKHNILLHLDVISICLLIIVTFFSFQNQLYFLGVSLKFHKTFTYSPFHDVKPVCFLCDQMPNLLTWNIYKEYADLFLLLKNSLDFLHIHLFPFFN